MPGARSCRLVGIVAEMMNDTEGQPAPAAESEARTPASYGVEAMEMTGSTIVTGAVALALAAIAIPVAIGLGITGAIRSIAKSR